MIRFSHAPDPPAVQFTFLPRNAVQMFTFYVALRFFGTLPIGKKVVLFAALCLSFFALSLCIHKYLLCSPQPLNLALLLLCNLPNDSQTQSRINAIFKLFTAMVRKKKQCGGVGVALHNSGTVRRSGGKSHRQAVEGAMASSKQFMFA